MCNSPEIKLFKSWCFCTLACLFLASPQRWSAFRHLILLNPTATPALVLRHHNRAWRTQRDSQYFYIILALLSAVRHLASHSPTMFPCHSCFCGWCHQLKHTQCVTVTQLLYFLSKCGLGSTGITEQFQVQLAPQSTVIFSVQITTFTDFSRELWSNSD